MGRPRHPKWPIEEAVQYAESKGWRWELSNGHPWGKLQCGHRERDGCKMWVQSTPKSPVNHAEQIKRKVDRCPHVT